MVARKSKIYHSSVDELSPCLEVKLHRLNWFLCPLQGTCAFFLSNPSCSHFLSHSFDLLHTLFNTHYRLLAQISFNTRMDTRLEVVDLHAIRLISNVNSILRQPKNKKNNTNGINFLGITTLTDGQIRRRNTTGIARNYLHNSFIHSHN